MKKKIKKALETLARELYPRDQEKQKKIIEYLTIILNENEVKNNDK